MSQEPPEDTDQANRDETDPDERSTADREVKNDRGQDDQDHADHEPDVRDRDDHGQEDHEPDGHGYEPIEPETDVDFDRRKFMRNVGAGAGASAVLGGAAGTAGAQEENVGLPADVAEDVEQPTAIRTFPVLDTDGEQTGSRTWRTVQGTGNCCENYLAVSPDGTVYDMGGELNLHVSPDRGQTWHTVEPSTPYPITSEGNVAPTPTGDIVAVDWCPYSGDRLIAFKYDAEDGEWYYNETPLKPPFYDRPWMAVLPGPFEVAGQEVPYVVVQRGSVGRTDETLLVSIDGLNYVPASERQLDAMLEEDVERLLTDVPEEEILDYVQPQIRTGVTPLGDGMALADGVSADCDRVIAEGGELRWSCFDTPTGLPAGETLADSRGYLHQVNFETTTFTYRYSTDGGETWEASTYEVPGGYEVSAGHYDFKVHGGHDVTAVAAHGTHPEAVVDQDIVFKMENAVEGPRETEVLYVGRADATYQSSASTSERFDFTTVGILPEDGRLVVSFADLEDTDPQLAFEVDDREELPPFDRLGVREDDSDAGTYTGDQTARMEVHVEAARECRLRDRIPEAWSVDAERNVDVAWVEHRPDEGAKYVYLEPDDGDTVFDVTYYLRTPAEATETGPYELGPLEANPGDGSWRPVDDTGATYVVGGGV